MGRSKEDQGRRHWDGYIGDTRRDWLRWVLKFAQTRARNADLGHCLEVAVFVRVYQGMGVQRKESDSERELRKARARLADLKSRQVRAQGDRDSTRAETLKDAIERQKDAIRLLRAARRAALEQPSEAEVGETHQALREMLARLMELQKEDNGRREIPYPVARRAIRWYPKVGRYIRYHVTDAETESSTKEDVPGGRFAIVELGGWKDPALVHFCELVARFGHELRKCEGRGEGHIRWFLPMRDRQRACSSLCAGRTRVNRFRQRSKATADRTRA